jgi:gas vesicle protein
MIQGFVILVSLALLHVNNGFTGVRYHAAPAISSKTVPLFAIQSQPAEFIENLRDSFGNKKQQVFDRINNFISLPLQIAQNVTSFVIETKENIDNTIEATLDAPNRIIRKVNQFKSDINDRKQRIVNKIDETQKAIRTTQENARKTVEKSISTGRLLSEFVSKKKSFSETTEELKLLFPPSNKPKSEIKPITFASIKQEVNKFLDRIENSISTAQKVGTEIKELPQTIKSKAESTLETLQETKEKVWNIITLKSFLEYYEVKSIQLREELANNDEESKNPIQVASKVLTILTTNDGKSS